MIRATLRTMTGRKGSFVGGTLVVLAAILIVIGIVLLVHGLRPGRNPSMGGRPVFDGTSGVLWLLGTVVAILIGSLAGSYDAAQGTMRYLIMTGARRGQVYGARTIALVLAVWLALLPAFLVGCAAALVLPHESVDKVTLADVGGLLWTIALVSAVLAVISMGIGAVLRSNGAAIAISLIFFIGFTPLLLLLERVSGTLGDLTLLPVLDRLTGADEGVAIPFAALAAAVWVLVFWGAGRLRVQRDEY